MAFFAYLILYFLCLHLRFVVLTSSVCELDGVQQKQQYHQNIRKVANNINNNNNNNASTTSLNGAGRYGMSQSTGDVTAIFA